MKKCFLVFMFLLLILVSKSQDKVELDSLLHILNGQQIDTLQLQANRAIGDYYMYINAGKAIEYFEMAKNIAIKLNRTLDIASNYYSIGFCNLMKGKYDLSLDNYFHSVRLYEKLKDDRRLANAYLSIINVYFHNGDLIKANEYYEKANIIISARKDSSQFIDLFNAKSQFYYKESQYDSALYYLKKQYQITNLLKDTLSTITLLSNMGLNYKKLKRQKEALEYCNTALTLLKRTNANDYYPVIYNNLGSIHASIGHFVEAKEAFDKSITYSLQIGNKSVEMENYLNLSDMYGDMRNFNLQNVYLKKYYSIKDSLFTIDSRNQMTQLESDYQLGKKNIEIIKKDADIKQQRNQRNIFFVIAIATLVLLTTLYYFFLKIQRKKIQLENKNIQIISQKTELEKLNHVKDKLFSIISHDLRNPIVNLRSFLLMSNNDNLNSKQRMNFKNQILNSVSQTGEMIDNLLVWANMQMKNTKSIITPINLRDCVSDIISTLEVQAIQKQVKLEAQIDDIIIPSDFNILTIALRNLVTNAIKFSHENQTVTLNSYVKDKYLFLTIKDNGVGMSQEQINLILSTTTLSTTGTNGEKGSGLGLFLVKELLSQVHHELCIESKLNEGSQFIIKIALM